MFQVCHSSSTESLLRRLRKIMTTTSVRMASETPARLIGVDDRKGTLAKGKDADIVILDKELNVRCVWSMGKIVPGTDILLHK